MDRIKRATPIESVVQARMPELKRRGKLYWACCPFHDEKTPSFTVAPARGTWRCFGACAEGGDSIGFVQRFDGLSFWDALTLLANECGEALPARGGRERRPGEDERRERSFELLERATRLYARLLAGAEGGAARAYLEDRGLGAEIAARFGCGWAPARGNPLLEAASEAGFELDLLVEVGLVKRADDGRPYDFFRNRLLVPIRDRLGRTVGFGGRILPDNEARAPKYVNTPETPLFHKGRLIFGLDRAADDVRRKRHLVLVEGYTDVMAAHQAGLERVAAVLGTATTADHAALVRRSGAERVTLVFDGDAAGGKASEKALGELLPLGLPIDVAIPPDGQDPCDLLVGAGAEAFEALLSDASDWFRWALDGLRGKEGATLAEGVEDLFALLVRLERPVEEALRRKELAEALGIPVQAIEAQWDRWRSGRPLARRRPEARAEEPREGEAPDVAPADPREREVFSLLVGALLLDNSLIPLYAELCQRAPACPERRIFEAVLHQYEHGDETEPIHAGSILTLLADDPARELVTGLEVRAQRAESPQALARDQELWLDRRDHERELRALRARLAHAEQAALAPEAGDGQSSDDLLRNLHAELKKRRVPNSS